MTAETTLHPDVFPDTRIKLLTLADRFTDLDDYDMPADALAYHCPHLDPQRREEAFSRLLQAVVAAHAGFDPPAVIEAALDGLTGHHQPIPREAPF